MIEYDIDNDGKLTLSLFEVLFYGGYIVLEQSEWHLCLWRGLVLAHSKQVAGLPLVEFT